MDRDYGGPVLHRAENWQFEIPYDYRVSRYPVTNSQFGKFREARGDHDWKDHGAPFNLPNHPVVGLSWHAAVAFAEWLTELLRSEGTMASNEEVRLPSEPEWEKACPAPLCTPPVRVQRSQSQAGPPLLRAPPCSGRGCRASGRFP